MHFLFQLSFMSECSFSFTVAQPHCFHSTERFALLRSLDARPSSEISILCNLQLRDRDKAAQILSHNHLCLYFEVCLYFSKISYVSYAELLSTFRYNLSNSLIIFIASAIEF